MNEPRKRTYEEMMDEALEIGERNTRNVRAMLAAGERGTDLFKMLDSLDAMYRSVWMIAHEWKRDRGIGHEEAQRR